MEDKLIDADVLTELKGRMKDNCVIPDGSTGPSCATNSLERFTVEDLREIDPKTYETCLGPVAVSSSVMPEPTSLASKEDFKDFMDELITYVENPTPTQATRVKTLQRMYNISVCITDSPEKFSARITISLRCGMWNVHHWDEIVPYDTAEIIKKAVDYL